jgi:hypothetical protein
MSELCVKCKGRGWCRKSCPILESIREFQPRIEKEFSGSSPPEVFIGKANYPKVFTGILAPAEYGNTETASMPELWHANKLDIPSILKMRAGLIYSRFISDIHSPVYSDYNKTRNFQVMQEVAMASKSVSLEFKLKEKPIIKMHVDNFSPVIGNPALLDTARFQENTHIERKVDYLVNDADVKASLALNELYKSNIPVSNMIKILSVGSLGLKKQRKLVPTRWAVTAVDSTLSNQLIDRIRFYKQISEFLLFNSEYLGNHYEILMIPGEFSYEVMEAKMPASVWNPSGLKTFFCIDHEDWYGRKDYAANCAGGYYAPRLAVSEWLGKNQRQASVLVMRECRPEYWAPCGVGILREICRAALEKKPERFSNMKDALNASQKRMRLKISDFVNASNLCKKLKEQTRLSAWI